MKKKFGQLIAVFTALIMLILDSETAITGARDGIQVCLYSVVPSIFPFLIFSGILIPALSSLRLPILRPLGKLLGIPEGAETVFLAGLLGGYPTGAQIVAKMWEGGKLKEHDARRMLGFCSNAGPSFLFGILGLKFAERRILWALWIIHILSAVIAGILLPGRSKSKISAAPLPHISVTDVMKSSVQTMGFICGWVVLFRTVLAFMDRWLLWLVPASIRISIYGILELANGCCSADHIASTGLRFVLCSGMLAFGGICVGMQTASVTGKLGLGQYPLGKLLQTAIAVAEASILQYFFISQEQCAPIPVFLLILPAFIPILYAFLSTKMKNRGRNPVEIGV